MTIHQRFVLNMHRRFECNIGKPLKKNNSKSFSLHLEVGWYSRRYSTLREKDFKWKIWFVILFLVVVCALKSRKLYFISYPHFSKSNVSSSALHKLFSIGFSWAFSRVLAAFWKIYSHIRTIAIAHTTRNHTVSWSWLPTLNCRNYLNVDNWN